MKLISWNEKYPDRTKDAEDLLFIMENYVDVIDQNILYVKEATLLEEEDFDNQIACIRLLGRNIAKISNTDTLNKIKIQFNVGRIFSTSAKVDMDSIKNRSCFLCEKNLPEEQKEKTLRIYYL